MENKGNRVILNWILFILIIIAGMVGTKNFNLINQNLIGHIKQFEYKIEYFDDFGYESELNVLGSNGWQIVGSRRATSSGEYGYELILMKEK